MFSAFHPFPITGGQITCCMGVTDHSAAPLKCLIVPKNLKEIN
jgi:hypothetical protein